MADSILTIVEPTHEVIVVQDSGTQIVVSADNNTTHVVEISDQPEIQIVTVAEQGPPGKPGEKGEQGEPGIDSFYFHRQDSPSKVWNIIHNLNKYPSVTVVDSANWVVLGDCKYIDKNSLTLIFSASFSGSAY